VPLRPPRRRLLPDDERAAAAAAAAAVGVGGLAPDAAARSGLRAARAAQRRLDRLPTPTRVADGS